MQIDEFSLAISTKENLESTTINLNKIEQQINDPIQIEQNYSLANKRDYNKRHHREKEGVNEMLVDFQTLIVEKPRQI